MVKHGNGICISDGSGGWYIFKICLITWLKETSYTRSQWSLVGGSVVSHMCKPFSNWLSEGVYTCMKVERIFRLRDHYLLGLESYEVEGW